MEREDHSDSSESEFNSSELGTKEHWDRVYKDELNNFSSHGDVGEIWFGEESILRIVNWLSSEYHGCKDDPIIDIGCGNGMTLVELAREGFRNLIGIDYSEAAIQLAVSIVEEQSLSAIVSLKVTKTMRDIRKIKKDTITAVRKINHTCSQCDIPLCFHLKEIRCGMRSFFCLNCHETRFKVRDIVSDEIDESSIAVAIDKGTYDAVSLDPVSSKKKRSIYVKKVHSLLRPNGVLIITSCNWTDDELRSQFDEYFSLITVIGTPEFHFAGKIGKLVSCVVLQRKNRDVVVL